MSRHSASSVACDLRLELGVLDGRQDLDAVVEVARHQVGAAHAVEAPPVRLEDEDPAVLEVAAEDAADADVRAQLRHAGPQRADAAHEEVDLRAGLGGGVELVDDLRMR